MVIIHYTPFNIEYGINIIDINFNNGFKLPSKTGIIEFFRENLVYLAQNSLRGFIDFKYKNDKKSLITLFKKENQLYRFLPNFDSQIYLENLVNEHFLPFLLHEFSDETDQKTRIRSMANKMLKGSENGL